MKTKLNIANWRKLRRHVANNQVAIDQNTFGEALESRLSPIRISELSCGTPGCLAYHAVLACAKSTNRVRYETVARCAAKLLGLSDVKSGGSTLVNPLFNAHAQGWPSDIEKVYNSNKHDGLHRKLAMLELIDRVIKFKDLSKLEPTKGETC